MEIRTYSLRDGESASEEFYRQAGRFAEVVLARSERRLGPAADAYRQTVRADGTEASVRSAPEYAFELLALGVLWRTYLPSARHMEPWQGRLLRRLVKLRSASPRLKPAADRARAAWGSRWLVPAAAHRPAWHNRGGSAGPDPDDLKPLLLWLEASGEFLQEAERFRRWQRYVSKLPPAEARGILTQALEEAAWFETASESALGRYTRKVDPFRMLQRHRYRHREDAILTDRRRVEYHLNLVGAEIMNRAYRGDYGKTRRRAALLPACLKTPGPAGCASVRQGTPFRCLGCSPDCRIGQLTAVGKRRGFEVLIVPHESDAFSRASVERLVRERIGIVGVACALNLLAGGWRAKGLGIPAQCVILDYCGCRDHWDDAGFPTDLNQDRLLHILSYQLDQPDQS